jgi:hypothetical protein
VGREAHHALKAMSHSTIHELTEPAHTVLDELVDMPPALKLSAKRKKASTSPTQRSLKHMRELGYVCAVVEHWNPHARIRQDLFGFIDVLCVKGEDIIGVQACSGAGGDSAARVRKITEHANWPLICGAIRVVVQSWRKNAAGKWMLREVEI